MPARRSETWRQLEAVQREVLATRTARDRARMLAQTWQALPDDAKAARWTAQARELSADLRELMHVRGELAIAIAVRQAPAQTTKGTVPNITRAQRGKRI